MVVSGCGDHGRWCSVCACPSPNQIGEIRRSNPNKWVEMFMKFRLFRDSNVFGNKNIFHRFRLVIHIAFSRDTQPIQKNRSTHTIKTQNWLLNVALHSFFFITEMSLSGKHGPIRMHQAVLKPQIQYAISNSSVGVDNIIQVRIRNYFL